MLFLQCLYIKDNRTERQDRSNDTTSKVRKSVVSYLKGDITHYNRIMSRAEGTLDINTGKYMREGAEDEKT